MANNDFANANAAIIAAAEQEAAAAKAKANHVSESDSEEDEDDDEIVDDEMLAKLNEHNPKDGRWSLNQEILFHYALKKYGKGRWREIEQFVPNR